MDAVDSVDLRAIEKLQKGHGAKFDGSVGRSLKRWKSCSTRMASCGVRNSVSLCSAWEQCLYNVQKPFFKLSRALQKIIDRKSPFLECELPIDGSCFAGQLPPLVAGPTLLFVRKPTIFLLDEYVDKA